RHRFGNVNIRPAADANTNRQRSGKHYARRRHSPRRTPQPAKPSRSRARHFFAQTRLEAGVEIRRRFGRLPFIEQRHGLLKLPQMGGTGGTGCDVVFDLRRCRAHASGSCYIRQQFPNLIAIHTAFLYFPETNSFSCSRKVSYARYSNDLVADSLSFSTLAIWRKPICCYLCMMTPKRWPPGSPSTLL